MFFLGFRYRLGFDVVEDVVLLIEFECFYCFARVMIYKFDEYIVDRKVVSV